ncbi:MAG: hypothetical protein PHI85_07585 [Victivallaceae bacterium]|nr:hypothetical protein [Victivallaceae bacterium]
MFPAAAAAARRCRLQNSGEYIFASGVSVGSFSEIAFNGATVAFTAAQDFSNATIDVTSDLIGSQGWSTTVATGTLNLTGTTFMVNGNSVTLGTAFTINGMEYLLDYADNKLTLSSTVTSPKTVNSDDPTADYATIDALFADLKGYVGEIDITGGTVAGDLYANGTEVVVKGTTDFGANSIYGGGTATAAGSGNWLRLCGGGNVTSAVKTQTVLVGNSTLTVNAADATVNHYACGGWQVSGSANLFVQGNSVLVISGGSFAGNIYGGNITTRANYGAQPTLLGNTAITVDCQVNRVTIGKHLYGGSNGEGVVTGTSVITFSGLGANLAFTGWVSGDSSGGGYWCNETPGVDDIHKYVGQDRSLVFNSFSGNFNASGVTNIDTVKFSNGSSVTMNNAIELSAVKNWIFDYTDSATRSLLWGGENDFSSDTLIVGKDTDMLTGSWTVLDGSAASLTNWDDPTNNVMLFGQKATFESGCWVSTDFTLSLDKDGNNDLIAAAKIV